MVTIKYIIKVLPKVVKVIKKQKRNHLNTQQIKVIKNGFNN